MAMAMARERNRIFKSSTKGRGNHHPRLFTVRTHDASHTRASAPSLDLASRGPHPPPPPHAAQRRRQRHVHEQKIRERHCMHRHAIDIVVSAHLRRVEPVVPRSTNVTSSSSSARARVPAGARTATTIGPGTVFHRLRLAVDSWAPGCRYYLLTHLHADHIVGLREGWAEGVLLTTPPNARALAVSDESVHTVLGWQARTHPSLPLSLASTSTLLACK